MDLKKAGLVAIAHDGAGQITSVSTHPLIQKYFADRLRRLEPEAWKAAHERLYFYLLRNCEPDNPAPSLRDLEPFRWAVAHGCMANMHDKVREDVYGPRILRDDIPYITELLGAYEDALNTVRYFFDVPWTGLPGFQSNHYRAWTMADAASCLMAVGRTAEALEPLRASYNLFEGEEYWREAAIVSNHLTDVQILLGDLKGAVTTASNFLSISEGKLCGFGKVMSYAACANAFYERGMTERALEYFRRADDAQAMLNPDLPQLFSWAGFRYCDSLLSHSERLAWRRTLGLSSDDVSLSLDAHKEACRRAERALQLSLQTSTRLNVGMNLLTLARAALYTAILDDMPLDDCKAIIDRAFRQIDATSHSVWLPQVLATRAWISMTAASRQRAGNAGSSAKELESSARADLDRAWNIAYRGTMPLHMADIHLHRVRLFLHSEPYPWTCGPRHDLKAADGYRRRNDEFRDAADALNSWTSKQ